ncbi:MAG: hypothetical protein Unbinned2819contig1000_35 [Prokaryotic dsDNA virus sp.]|nr:MAG: hypothetical protein Unbinned2819contig1000_35 [Prokaryotic dsDNA virus sp.]|tara:strand:- start:4476 stop:5099 length:624 start_codon:yes stop_codon:yes gene_type:complete
MRLHNITSNPDLFAGATDGWCGPAAISAITGRSRECASAWINFKRFKMPHHLVRGSQTSEVVGVLRCLGYAARSAHVGCHHPQTPTLAQWMKGRSPAERRQVFLVVAGYHFIVVKGNKAVCGLTGDKVATSKSRKRRAKVVSLHVITEIDSLDAAATRAKRIDPLPEWSRWHARLLEPATHAVLKRRYKTRPYSRSHEIESHGFVGL